MEKECTECDGTGKVKNYLEDGGTSECIVCGGTGVNEDNVL